MNLGLLSLLLLALAIVVGFLWNGNVGLLCGAGHGADFVLRRVHQRRRCNLRF